MSKVGSRQVPVKAAIVALVLLSGVASVWRMMGGDERTALTEEGDAQLSEFQKLFDKFPLKKKALPVGFAPSTIEWTKFTSDGKVVSVGIRILIDGPDARNSIFYAVYGIQSQSAARFKDLFLEEKRTSGVQMSKPKDLPRGSFCATDGNIRVECFGLIGRVIVRGQAQVIAKRGSSELMGHAIKLCRAGLRHWTKVAALGVPRL